MSVWNSVLQACHSSLIDELNARFPDDKLELGLPKRFEGWGKTEGPDLLLFREVQTEEGKGILAIGTLATKAFPTGEEILEGVLNRATKEFGIRSISATFGKSVLNPPPLRMTIWLPIRIPSKNTIRIYDLAICI